jgi:hypothetical protein
VSRKRVTIVVGDDAAEALRGAVGLTLRGDAITVVHAGPLAGAEPARARATLELFGHRIAGIDALPAALDADAIEIWGPVPAIAAAVDVRRRQVLHLVRPGRQAAAVAPGEQVVHLDGLDDDQLLDLVLAAGTVAVW